MSEKLDGIRSYWDGKNLWTRNKKRIIFPPFFTYNWPSTPLDGELYTKKQDFNNCV